MFRVLSIIFNMLWAVSIFGQTVDQESSKELQEISDQYQLTASQKQQVKQLISKRNEDLISLGANKELDEPRSTQKRSSIYKGFEGSINLLLDKNQKNRKIKHSSEKRKARITLIERLKKEGYSQAEIFKQLNKI